MTELGKQVWKKMEEMGWKNAPEGFHLEYYENIIECTKQALNIPAVVGRSEQLVCCHCKGSGKIHFKNTTWSECFMCNGVGIN